LFSKYIFENPEIIRYKNVSFRKNKAISLTSIYLLMLTIVYSIIYFSFTASSDFESASFFKVLYSVTMAIQYISVFYIGTYFVVTSMFQERDKETFDFLRMSTIDRKVLAVGKLLGPNIFIYFLVLIMTPFIFLFSILGDVPLYNFFGSYLNIFIFGILYHSIGLFLGTTLTNTKSNSPAGLAIGVPIFSNFMTAFSSSSYINPFYNVFAIFSKNLKTNPYIVFYSYPFPDFIIMFLIISFIVFWCMLFIVRKMDYDQNKIMTKKQSLAFVSSFQFILLGLTWNLFLSQVSVAIYLFMTINLLVQLLIIINLTPDKDDTIVFLNKDKNNLNSIFDSKSSISSLISLNSIIILIFCLLGSIGDFFANGKIDGFMRSVFMYIPFILFSLMYTNFFYISKLVFVKKQTYIIYSLLVLSFFIPIPIAGITKGSSNIIESFLINPLVAFANLTVKDSSSVFNLISLHNIIQLTIILIIILVLNVMSRSKKEEIKKKYVV
jgi:hypothetical protein